MRGVSAIWSVALAAGSAGQHGQPVLAESVGGERGAAEGPGQAVGQEGVRDVPVHDRGGGQPDVPGAGGDPR